MTTKRSLLVIDDSLTIRSLIQGLFTGNAFVEIVDIVGDSAEAVKSVMDHRPDVITLDIVMPGIDGFSVLESIMRNVPTPAIMLSSSGTVGSDLCKRALAMGAAACFDKAHLVKDAPRFIKMVRGLKIPKTFVRA